MHTMYYDDFLLTRAILERESKISIFTTLEFQEFSAVFQDLCLFPGFSRLVNLSMLISGLCRGVLLWWGSSPPGFM